MGCDIVMKKDQEIFQEIGRLLWSIMPLDIEKIILFGKDYESYSQTQFILKDKKGILRSFAFQEANDDQIGKQILDLAIKLRFIPPYTTSPWTHFKVELTDNCQFKIDFKYISWEDDSSGIFMRTANESPFEDELS